MYVGRKLYYDKATGNVILDTGEHKGIVRETTVEEDFQSYKALAERVPETVGCLQLEFGQYAEDFATCNGYRVNPDTLEIEFSYPDPNEQEPQESVYQKPLSERIVELENENLELKLALAEAVEANEQDKTEIQLAIAELAELVVGGGQVG